MELVGALGLGKQGKVMIADDLEKPLGVAQGIEPRVERAVRRPNTLHLEFLQLLDVPVQDDGPSVLQVEPVERVDQEALVAHEIIACGPVADMEVGYDENPRRAVEAKRRRRFYDRRKRREEIYLGHGSSKSLCG
jgi:hypothetical protein